MLKSSLSYLILSKISKLKRGKHIFSMYNWQETDMKNMYIHVQMNRRLEKDINRNEETVITNYKGIDLEVHNKIFCTY